MRLHAMWDHHDGGNLSHFLEGLAEAVEKEAWLQLGLSFQEFISSPAPDGLDIPLEQFKAAYHIRHRKEKYFPTAVENYSKMRKKINTELSKAPPPGKRPTQPELPEQAYITYNISNISRGTHQGTSPGYAIRRLRSEGYEELADKVAAEEVSANKAMIQVGLRPKTGTFYPEDRYRTARALLKHFDPDELYAAMKGTL